MSSTSRLDVPPSLRRTLQPTEDDWIASAERSIELLCRVRGVANLGATSVLDVGCGTKIVKTLLERDLPIGRYVGVDVSREVIDFLRANVDDPRFEFQRVNLHNDLYNPEGNPLGGAETPLLSTGEQFDVVSLFSVFTHLAPHDFPSMLRAVRPHAARDGRLIFSLFINEGGRVDPRAELALRAHLDQRLAEHDPEVEARVTRAIVSRPELVSEGIEQALAGGDAEVEALIARALADTTRTAAVEVRPPEVDVPDFEDLLPDQPLAMAVYSRPFAFSLIDGTGWDVLSLNAPEGYIQHYFVCRPVAA
jgi:SAM-dependent methyltransferase